ncbi:response regulator transcription factor [Actinomadura livida]|uniref:DNA-binding NarL/FixJ family response regulator n=1 Tax=Actinomadura livida TaxID=79909 RepID=A0A7W7IFI1_9ACTN|nr:MULTISPECIES: response regulator transcription factor [Actinomadura]MBB4776056.1 DNA-binding NarL/FixJ family response regulator [Actinomadura catellatispora]GGU15804.1 DNA-binding response regulator [Actinomadura livida]
MQPDQPETTVLLVDDHALVREGLREILGYQDDMVVVGEAGDSQGAVEQTAEKRPHVVLLDIEIPGDDATTTVARIRERSPHTAVLILSMYEGPELLQSLLDVGVRGYLLKSVTKQELVSAIRSVRFDKDRVVVSVSRESIAGSGQSDPGGPPMILSDREREVLELTAQALSNRQIAAQLSLTEATVKRHLRNIFVKLGAASRIDAVNKAVEGALIEVGERRQAAAHR